MRKTAAAAVVLIVSLATVLGAQGAPVPARGEAPAPPPMQPPAAVGEPNPISAGQIQRWFEAFTVLQAQDALHLTEAQYGRFVTRLKALQDARRRHQQARNQILGDLRRLTNPQTGTNDEAAMADRLKVLREEDERAAAEMRKAYEAVEDTLDIPQQARFRLFEDRMEQQKLELLMRARQNARAARKQ